MSNYPKCVDSEHWPEKTIENVPDEKIRAAMSTLRWEQCPHCNGAQWFNYRSGWNKTVECDHCGEPVKLVG